MREGGKGPDPDDSARRPRAVESRCHPRDEEGRSPPSFPRPSPEALAEIREIAERRLSREEFQAWVGAPMSDDERRGILEMVEWFQRRYPTPAERLAYARRAYARWMESRGL